MKKTFTALFVLLVLFLLAFQFQPKDPLKESSVEALPIVEIVQKPNFTKFLNEHILVSSLFQKHYTISVENILKATSSIRSNKPINSSFKIEALQNIRDAYKVLENLEIALAEFNEDEQLDLNSECLTFCHLAKKMMDEHHKFISKPETYLKDDAQLKRYGDKAALLKEQLQLIAQLSENRNHHIFSTNRITKQAIEYRFTKEELKATERWKSSTFETLIEDAHKGDAAALYMVGLCLLDGHGMAINTGNAHDYFAASASLGFVPALGHLRAKHMNHPSNPFLALVYTNLMIAYGHNEYAANYQQQKDLLSLVGGEEVVKEIERISYEKKAEITNAQIILDWAKDKREAALRVYDSKGIIADDILYDLRYWEKLFEKTLI